MGPTSQEAGPINARSAIVTKDSHNPRTARGRRQIKWRRLLLWGFAALAVLIATSLGGSYLWFRGVVGTASSGAAVAAAKEVVDNKPPASAVSPAVLPQGTDVLVLGSDRRSAGNETHGRSDTLMLVHVDPEAGFISLLSLPRDLRVEVTGHGFQKINAAYAFGGAALAIETVQNVTGVDVDHYVEIDFGAFKDVTNSIGGVYVDVDRRYYYDGLDYENIKLAPGYQLLSGDAALDYVRFRHDQDVDFGRMERQQRFLRAVREQALGWGLAFKLPAVVKSLFANVATEMSAADVIELAHWAIDLRGGQVNQVVIRGDIKTISGVSYVVATDQAIREAVRDFLSPPAVVPGASAFGATSGGTAPAGAADQPNDLAKWAAVASETQFAIQGPIYVPAGYSCVEKRVYEIATSGGAKPAVKAVYRYEKTDQYMGIMETTWLGAPAASSGESIEHAGLTFTVVGIDEKVDRVWWVKDGVLNWVSNTLFYSLGRNELLAVAQSMITVPR
jgi:LCP family protein required for cell wall assembly